MTSLEPVSLGMLFGPTEIRREALVAVTLGPSADQPHTLCYAATAEILAQANQNAHVAAIITTAELADQVSPEKGCVVAGHPRLAFYAAHNALFRSGHLHPPFEHFIHPETIIAPTAIIGHPVRIGRGVRIGPATIIGAGTVIGADTLVEAHVCIGGRGSQDMLVDGRRVFVEFAGGVRIGQRCEILACVVIPLPYQRTFTELGDDLLVGSHASIGHDSCIGSASFIGANAVISGHVRIGREVWVGPSVTVSNDLVIGDRARLLIGSVVVRDVPPGETVSGNFAVPHAANLRQSALRRGSA